MNIPEMYYWTERKILMEATLTEEDEVQERRDTISNKPDLFKRFSTLALHKTVRFVGARRILNAYESPYRWSGFEVLGHGFNATALLSPDGKNVRKIIRGSDRLSDEGRADLVRDLERKIAANNVFHSEIITPTSVTIDTSPVLGRQTVQLVQPYVANTPEKVDPRDVIDFAERSLDEMLRTGYLPDTIGRQNLVNTDDGIRLIDTVAIPIEDTASFGKCAARLYEMARIGQ